MQRLHFLILNSFRVRKRVFFLKMLTEFCFLAALTLNSDEREVLRNEIDEWVKFFLPKLEREATAKYKNIACFAFPFLSLIFGILFFYNAYLIATEDQLGHGGSPGVPFRLGLMFFGMFIFTIPVLCCSFFIVGDADKVNIEICSR